MLNSRQQLASEPPWGIREFADMFDVTPRTLRFYEDKGLLKPARDGLSRIFNRVEYARFMQIMRAKRLGFSLEDIKEVMEVIDGQITDRIELLRRQRNFRHVIGSLKRRREDIANVTQDMVEICDLIDTHLEGAEDNAEIFTLASAYEAKFNQTPFIEETADDFHPASRG